MANVKLSQLPELITIPDDAVIYLVHNGVSYRVTKENLVGTGPGATPTLQQVTEQINGNTTTFPLVLGGLTIADKLNFITALISQIRNVSFQDKDGTVAYLEDIESNLSGLKWKNPVVVAIDTPLGYSGLIPQMTGTTVQGVTLQHNDRVLLISETNSANNGCYRANTTASPGNVRFYRTTDSDSETELVNALYPVTSGTYSEKTFRQTQTTININSTPIFFDDFGNSVSQATNLVAGIMKLYVAAGNNQDGTITQKAITDLLATKSDIKDQFKNIIDDTNPNIGNDTNAQDIFADEFTVEANKTYSFTGVLLLSGLSGTAHILSFGFAGTAGISFIAYTANGGKVSNNTTGSIGPGLYVVETAAMTALSPSNGNTAARYVIHGSFVSTTAGTFKPQLQLSLATTTGKKRKATFFKLTKEN